MIYLKKAPVIAITLSLLACATTFTVKANESPFGAWQTKVQYDDGSWHTHGKMTFTNKTKAVYELRNGRILFTKVDDQGKWKGRWVEDNQVYISCSDEIDGSKSWGEAIFQFDETYNTFKGTWDACGDGNTNSWVGYRS